MNELIIKRAFIFSIILGACIGIFCTIPPAIGLGTFILMLLSAPIVILYMKKHDMSLNFLNNEHAAIYGAITGFGSTIGFFASFSPLVCIFKLVFKNYYAYMIPDLLTTAIWLFFILIFMLALIFAATNAASAMGLAWIYSYFEKKIDDTNRLDMKIED